VDRPHLVAAPNGVPALDPLSLDNLPDAVLAALREIRHIRDKHVNNLCVGDRRLLAAAERLQAHHIDLQAQIDANGADHRSEP
jgi:hypothetical protein